MPIPGLEAVTGALPVGRYGCTEAEVEQFFVRHSYFFNSTSRPGIWADWERAHTIVSSLLTVHSVWMAGSFTTNKLNPNDIDLVFVINGDEYDALASGDRQVLTLFAGGLARGMPFHELHVDSYIIPWRSIQDPAASGFQTGDYYGYRGYWDDWWSRLRASSGPPCSLVEATAPRRGYLEINYDDYH